MPCHAFFTLSCVRANVLNEVTKKEQLFCQTDVTATPTSREIPSELA
jgi:hypothetical protein